MTRRVTALGARGAGEPYGTEAHVALLLQTSWGEPDVFEEQVALLLQGDEAPGGEPDVSEERAPLLFHGIGCVVRGNAALSGELPARSPQRQGNL